MRLIIDLKLSDGDDTWCYQLAIRGEKGGRNRPIVDEERVKTITVPGVNGVLENPDDVDRYLEALRGALLDTLKDGKRISL